MAAAHLHRSSTIERAELEAMDGDVHVEKFRLPPFEVSPSFDLTKNTDSQYAAPPSGEGGRFAAERALLDHSWHKTYAAPRAAYQDALISGVVDAACVPVAGPVLLFSCGGMGAGKTTTVRRLAARGALPLERFVVCDPDLFKRLLPEYPLYVRADAGAAASHMQAESGTVAEVAFYAGLAAGKSVFFDGSMRDAAWHRSLIELVRARFPRHRIGIVYVTATREVCHRRIAQRRAVTGMAPPERLVNATFDAVAASFEALAPLVDFTFKLDNSVDFEDATFLDGGSIEKMAQVFAATECAIPAEEGGAKRAENQSAVVGAGGEAAAVV